MKLLKYCLAVIFLITAFSSKSQYCGNITSNLSITPTTSTQLTPIYTSGRRAFNFSVQAGCTYEFSTCGYTSMDTYLRLYSTSTGGSILASNDDDCGLQSTIQWTATFTGSVSVLLTRYNCRTINSSTRMSYRVVSCLPPDCTTPITPLDGETDVTLNTVLQWDAVQDASDYDVYFGTNTSPPLVSTQNTTQYTPSLNFNTTYYWKIVPKNSMGSASSCPVWSFTTGAPGCLNSLYGQYPSATYSPTCSGSNEIITSSAWASEYTLIELISGVSYDFSSSVVTDFITISDEQGTTVLSYGTGSLTWTCPTDGLYRFYLHADNGCSSSTTSRIKRIQCSTPPPPTNDLVDNAIALDECGDTVSGNTKFATQQGDGPSCFSLNGENWTAPGVWYTIVGNGSNAVLSLCGSLYDTKVFVYTGSAQNLTCYAWNDDACGLQSEVAFATNLNETYHVLVTGYGNSKGSFTLYYTVTPIVPVIQTQPLSDTICSGGSVTLAFNATGVHGPLTYQWYMDGNIINGANSTTYTATVEADYYAIITNACGTSIQTNTVNVIVNNPPTLSSTIQNPSCYNSTDGAIDLHVTNTNETLSYLWTGPSGFSSTSEDISGLQPGNYTVTVTTPSGCIVSLTITLTQPQSLTLTATSTPSTSNNGTIDLTVSGGTPPYSYLWDNGSTTEDLTDLAPGTYTVTVTDANGCTEVTSVTVNQTTTNFLIGDIEGLQVVCDSVQVAYVKYQISLTPGVNYYHWELPQGMIIVSGQGTPKIFVEIDYSFVSGYITVVGQTSTGNTQPDSLYVSLIPPVPVFIEAPSCGYVGLNNVFTVENTPGVDFIWTPPYGAVILNGQGTSTVELKYSQSFTSGYLEVHAENACGASTVKQVFVDAVPDPAFQLYGNTSICSSQLETFWVDSASRADYYIWNMPAGAVIVGDQTNDTIQVQFSNFISGSITVMAANNCGSTAMKSISVTAQSISPATAIFGPTNACNYVGGNSVNYSTPVVSGITAYNWQVPAGASILSGQGTSSIWVEFAQGFTGGSLSVSLTDGCAVSSLTSLNIISSQSSTAGNISGPVDVCDFTSGLSATYTIPQVSGANSYNWQAPAGCTITNNGSNTVQIAYPNGFIMGTISVTVSFNCGSDALRTLNVTSQPQNTSIIGPACITPGQNYTYTINGGLGASTFNWTLSGSGTVLSGQGTNSVVVNYSTVFNAGILSVTPTSNCGTGQTSDLVVKVSAQIPNSIFGPSNLCTGDTVMYFIDDYTDVNYLIWSLPTGLQILNGTTADTILVVVGSSFVGGSMSVMRVNDCGSSPMKYKSLFGCQMAMSANQNNPIEINMNNNLLTPDSLVFDNEWRESIKLDIDIILFPNPTKNTINFRAYRGHSPTYKVHIKSALGTLVLETILKAEDKVDISLLESGVYYFTATDDNNHSITKKIVKQ